MIHFTEKTGATYRHIFDDTYYTTMKTKCQRNSTEIFPQFYRSLSEEKKNISDLIHEIFTISDEQIQSQRK